MTRFLPFVFALVGSSSVLLASAAYAGEDDDVLVDEPEFALDKLFPEQDFHDTQYSNILNISQVLDSRQSIVFIWTANTGREQPRWGQVEFTLSVLSELSTDSDGFYSVFIGVGGSLDVDSVVSAVDAMPKRRRPDKFLLQNDNSSNWNLIWDVVPDRPEYWLPVVLVIDSSARIRAARSFGEGYYQGVEPREVALQVDRLIRQSDLAPSTDWNSLIAKSTGQDGSSSSRPASSKPAPTTTVIQQRTGPDPCGLALGIGGGILLAGGIAALIGLL